MHHYCLVTACSERCLLWTLARMSCMCVGMYVLHHVDPCLLCTLPLCTSLLIVHLLCTCHALSPYFPGGPPALPPGSPGGPGGPGGPSVVKGFIMNSGGLKDCVVSGSTFLMVKLQG